MVETTNQVQQKKSRELVLNQQVQSLAQPIQKEIHNRFKLEYMKKLSLIVVVLFSAVVLNAQKVGHTDGQVLLFSMPEITKVNADLEKISGDFTTTMNEMQKDYQTKLQEFEANKTSWPEAILQSKYKAIMDLEKNMTDFEQTANTELEKSRNDLLQPLIEKIGKAIEDVAKEEGYSYVIDSSTGVLLYRGGDDLTDKIKVKLGIPLTAPTEVKPAPAPKN
jgi:outer membrane protein